ncbi:MAG: acetolactate synthase 3 large subunit [Alphaproteobacteria bacterium]
MTKTEHSGAEIIIKALIDQGVEVVFGYPGGAVLPIYDALFQQNHLRHILVRHEQAAVHAAEGYARSTGKPGVVLVTSGPGATNAVTGLTDALMDSIPLICLSGQVATHLIGNDAFQECDTTGITRPCTKHNYLVQSAATLPRIIHEAFYVATTGRPGPVLIDIPKDVQFASAEYLEPKQVTHKTYYPQIMPHEDQIAKALALITTAKKPIIYAGGGIINSGDKACTLLREFVRMTNFPCTLTLMGLGAYPADDRQFLGMLGMHGTYEANWAMHDSDVMICVGARFDDRITGRLDAFAPYAKKIHIDIDPSSINKNVQVDVPVVADVGEALNALISGWKASKTHPELGDIKAWWQQIEEWRKIDCLKFQHSADIIKPQHAIKRLYEISRERKLDTFITTEVGQHQMWAAQYFGFNEPNHWMTSGGLGTMGYGFPAAIGVQLAHPDALVVDIAGEASIQMNIQELSTAIQYRLPVKIFILNNRYLGMVRQWQELLHGSRYSESYSEALPDFVKLAEAYQGKGLRAETPDQLDQVINEMIDHKGMVVADICVDSSENCYPMIPSGAAHNEMLLGPVAEGTSAVSEAGKMLV